MKTIIIPDIHNRVDFIELALLSPVLQPYDNIVFLGDYFDDFHDTVEDIANSAKWLKQSIYKPGRIHLMGTHDVWYRFPTNPFVMASGNTIEKSATIGSILTNKDWKLLKLFHYEQSFLMTHAGVHQHLIDQYISQKKHILGKYIYDVDGRQVPSLNAQEVEQLSKLLIGKIIKPATEDALIHISRNMPDSWLDAGFARGGWQTVGGITWLDWKDEFEPIPDLNQIVGHTELQLPGQKCTHNSKNYCLDTRSQHIGILEDGKFRYVETVDVLEAIK